MNPAIVSPLPSTVSAIFASGFSRKARNTPYVQEVAHPDFGDSQQIEPNGENKQTADRSHLGNRFGNQKVLHEYSGHGDGSLVEKYRSP